jgi:transcription factor IIIB subunit 2
MSAPQVARAPRLRGLGDGYQYQSKATQRSKAPQVAATQAAKRTYNCCPNPQIDTSDNEVMCYNCGHVHNESNIVSEVTFGETSGGAAIVEGGFIHANQRHANSMGGTMRGLGGMESREQAAMNGKNSIMALGASLNQREAVIEQAFSWYKLAMNHRFIQGRRMRTVAAVAIYMAARRQPENTLMLIDLAEKIQTNVWQLGDTYKQFLEMLKEEDPAQLVGTKAVQEIEPLMLKYCRKLEFGEDSHRVADDACKVLKRMNRDWMVQGRQPAGLCGACIIIAARMNNFRRTIREVVYVVKVADSTISSRLYEYKRTESAALTVNQFREFGPRLKVKAQPPAIWRRAEKEERREKKKRQLTEGGDIAPVEIESGDSEVERSPGTTPKRSSKRRKSNDGSSQPVATQIEASGTQNSDPSTELAAFDGNTEAVLESVITAVEEVEAGEATDPDFVMPKKRGRPPKKQRVPVVIAEEDLEIEHDLEDEVTNTIKDWEAIFKEIANSEDHELLRRSGWTAAEMARVAADTRDIVPVNLDPEIGEDEFNDDPDVATCILNPEEVRRKEAIWITENEQWLRDQQKKMLEAELEAAEDKPKKPKQKRKHHQMGDGNVLEGQPATSAADAAHKMLKKRAKAFSNHINYDRLKELFPGGHTSASPSGSGQGASPASNIQPVVQQTGDADAEGEEEEEEEEIEEVEEEEDLEHNYLEDDDEGFANESYDY